MDCCRLENAPGVFLPNDKAAEKSGGLLVYRWSFRMPDAHASAFEHETRRPGWASLRAAPTTLESKDQRKFTETKLSKIPFL